MTRPGLCHQWGEAGHGSIRSFPKNECYEENKAVAVLWAELLGGGVILWLGNASWRGWHLSSDLNEERASLMPRSGGRTF